MAYPVVKYNNLKGSHMPRSLLLLLITAVLSGCATSASQDHTRVSVRGYIAHPGPYGSVLFRGFNRYIQDSADSEISTIYAVRHCQAPDRCELGVVKPQVSVEFLKATEGFVEIKAAVVYDIGSSQSTTMQNPETTTSVPNGMPTGRQEFTKTFSLKFGEQKRLQLPFQDSVVFCAQRVDEARAPIDTCPVPKTIEGLTAIQSL